MYHEDHLYEKALEKFETALKIAEGNEIEKKKIPIINSKINLARYNIEKYKWDKSPMPQWEDKKAKDLMKSLGRNEMPQVQNGKMKLNYGANEYLVSMWFYFTSIPMC